MINVAGVWSAAAPQRWSSAVQLPDCADERQQL